MIRAPVDGLELEYEVRGAGEPVVLIHAGVIAGFFAPLIEQPALVGAYRVVRHHRAGYAGSDRVEGPLPFTGQATHCRALMDHLGIERAHVVGHSSSACMALQLAVDAPEVVLSLALLDPARPAPPTALHRHTVETVLLPALDQYRAGDPAAAVDTFMRGVCGAGYRAPLEAARPGRVRAGRGRRGHVLRPASCPRSWSGRSTATPPLASRCRRWSFSAATASRSSRERQELLLDWLPNAEPFELPGASHLLQVQEPRAMAEALASFAARHPGSAPSSPRGVPREFGTPGGPQVEPSASRRATWAREY